MIEMTKKYRYRNGEPARIICVDRPHEIFKVISMSEKGILEFHTINGTADYDHNTDFDLIECKEKKVLWLNVYPDLEDVYAHESIESADGDPKKDRIARIKVTYEEGQLDE
jgi:hypothetical protein